ncbi:MAG: carbohydrate-binding protein, partial [Phaeodactylibacter sp.]|nr:carbohydrate-binding protein [Phaeodactylibacter sp.]
MKSLFTLLLVLGFTGPILYAQGLTIQENELGFCSVDGIVDTDVTGYTGDGFINADFGAGTSALWNITVPADGTYHIYWRYANGGGSGDLIAELWVNEAPLLTDYSFTHTGAWTNWTESDTVAVDLQAGENKIRLVSVSSSGLTNIDYFHVIEDGVEGAFCLPSYSLSLSKNFEQGGTVSFEPEQAFYEAGTEITLTA